MILVSFDANINSLNSFVINRPLKLKNGTYFNFISLSPKYEVNLYSNDFINADIALDNIYEYSNIHSSFQINELYTKFYQEKGTNYKFSGDSHNYWELTYVDRGVLYTNVDGINYKLEQGDLIFYSPSQFHTQSTDNSTIASYLTLNFDMKLDNDNIKLSNKVFKTTRNAQSILKNLMYELDSNSLFCDDLSLCFLKQLIIQLLRDTNKNVTYNCTTTGMKQNYENKTLHIILEYIDNNIERSICVNSLCSQFAISASTLHSLFKNNLRTTVNSYINTLKLNKSKELISESNYSISEISEMLGFSSIHYFSKKFKNVFGISPTEYSKSLYK
ncbi:MAG: helix-turn-helix domain-containing protein [Peptostreptococcaceae bacterium]